MKATYKKTALYAMILSVMFISAGFAAPGVTTEIVAWEDGFEEFFNPAFGGFQSHICGSSISGFPPPDDPAISKTYTYTGPFSAAPVIDCTFADTGSHSIQTRHNDDDGSGGFWARPHNPEPFFHPGETWVFEEDVYIPFGATCEFYIHSGGQEFGDAAGWRAASGEPWKWLIGTFADPPEDRFIDPNEGEGLAVQTDVWTHVRMEVYDEPGQPFSIWVTPKDGNGITHLVVDKAPSPVGVWPGGVHWFPWYLNRGGNAEQNPDADATYRDNIKQTRIDHQSQGYPVIGQAPVGITIDGTMAFGEWDGVVKVAEKPLNGHGDFEPLWGGNFDILLDPATFVDVWTAFDEAYFYIAARFNNAVVNPINDPEVAGDPSFFEVVFNWDFEDVALDVGYTYSVNALANSGDFGPRFKYVMDPANPPVGTGTPVGPPIFTAPDDPNVFVENGGMLAYTVVGDIMEVEMKIPFADLPEFTAPAAGEQVNMQFNVSGISDGW